MKKILLPVISITLGAAMLLGNAIGSPATATTGNSSVDLVKMATSTLSNPVTKPNLSQQTTGGSAISGPTTPIAQPTDPTAPKSTSDSDASPVVDVPVAIVVVPRLIAVKPSCVGNDTYENYQYDDGTVKTIFKSANTCITLNTPSQP